VRTLTRIRERLNATKNTNGLIVFAGLDEFGQEVMEVIDLKEGARLDVFYYNCSKKFDTEFSARYVRSYAGSIVFANGSDCMIYSFEGGSFRRVKHICANLQKRQRKGGMSSLRISRLAEESRHNYVVHVVDYLNLLETKNNWIFGSEEIVGMILSNKTLLVNMNNGGFLNFNSHTINDQKHFLGYLQASERDEIDDANEVILERILYYLDTNPDMLDFDADQRTTMKAYLMSTPEEADLTSNKYKPLPVSSKYFSRLQVFTYVGLKYYAYDPDFVNAEEAVKGHPTSSEEKRDSTEGLLDAYLAAHPA
jgi:hypothetical protein